MTPGWSEAPAGGDVRWPVWSAGSAPGDLARYIVPDVVRRHAEIPGPSEALVRDRLRTVWDRLRAVGIGYAHEQANGGAPVGGQWVRPPGEVLVAPRNGTCLDLAVLLAGACVHAGLRAGVIVLDAAEQGRPGHALLAVLLGGAWPGGDPDGGVWTSPPDGFVAAAQAGLDGPSRDVLVVDPNGIAHPVGGDVVGADVDLDAAVLAGHAHLASGRFVWRLGVVAQARDDAYVPAPVPRARPLRGVYRRAQTAESALKLLRAEYQVTPFQSRDELTVLLDFCQQVRAGDRTGIAVVRGVGGSGKTRLALELAERLRADGWYAGPLREKLADVDPAALAWLTEVTAPLAVIVDYADARVAEAQALLAVLAGRSGCPAVVLLTGRGTDGDWRESILGSLTTDAHPQVAELLELPDTHPRPGDIYRRTVQALAPSLTELPALPPDQDQDQDRWTTLDLVLLGWLAAQGRTELPAERGALYDDVLDHERRYWAKTYASITGQPRPDVDVLAKAATCLTLLSPARDDAPQVLRAVPPLNEDARWRADVARTMTSCLDAGAGARLSLRPDPVGDHHLLTGLRRWPELLDSCLPTGTGPEQLVPALLVLSRAGQGDGHQAAAQIERLIRTEPDRWPIVLAAATALGGPAVEALETLVQADACPIRLDTLSEHLPYHASGLWHLALLTDERRLSQARTPGAEPAALSGLLLGISQRRTGAGDRAGALAAIEEAVDLRRQLATANPAAFTPDLAGSLNNLSVQRSEVGDRVGALAAIEEAVDLYRQLATANPAAFTPDLAGSLNNLSNWRSEVGDRAGALAAIEEAVDLYRQLATANPAAFTPDLAGSLNNLSNWRSEAGDRAGALTAIEEAVDLYRQLATANPAAFTPDLAGSLNNLSVQRSEAGDRAGALTAIEEAVDLYRQLATANPAAFTPDLAGSLNNLSNRRSEAGDRAGALTAIEEAVQLRRQLATANPAAFTPDLAGSLNNLSVQRSEAGDRAGALTAIEEAVQLRRQLATANPAAFTPDLAGSLNNLSNWRSEVGDRAGALAAIEEAVDLYRQLATANPAAFTPNLAGSLNNLSNWRSEVGDRVGALAAIEEAVDLYRQLATANPAAFTPDLAGSLNNLSNWRSEVGDRAGALTAIEEAADLRRQLATANPAAFTPNLATSLNNLSNRRSEVGDRAGALTAIEEAADLYRQLATANPAAFTPNLATSLNNLSNQRSEAGDRAGALTAIEEAADLYRQLATANPAAFTPNLATSTRVLADLVAAKSTSAGLHAWSASADAVPVAACSAEIWANAAAWCAGRGDVTEASTLIHRATAEAAGPDESAPRFVISRTRQLVRAVARSLDPPPPGLPAWAVHPVPDPDLELVQAWAQAPSWPAADAALRAAIDVVTGQTLPSSLDVLLMLYPGDSNLERLRQLVALVAQHGVEPVLTQLGDQHRRQELIQAWISTSTWDESLTYLYEHREELAAPEAIEYLAGSDEPVAQQHAAILTLIQTVPEQTALELVTDPAAATDHALTALDRADLVGVATIAQANPNVLQQPGTGLTLLAVLLLTGGQADQALDAARTAAATCTPVQRRARVVNLKHFAEHAEPEFASAVAPLIEALNTNPAKVTDVNAGQKPPITDS